MDDEEKLLNYYEKQKIKHFEQMGRYHMADAIRMGHGIKPKHQDTKVKKGGLDSIRVDNEELVFDDGRYPDTPPCCSDNELQKRLKNVRVGW